MPDASDKTDANLHSVDENLAPYTQALRAHFPSKEAILQEARALSDKHNTRRKHLFKTSVLGSALTILLAVTWLIDPVLQSQNLTTEIGEKVSFQMQDGSTLTLNTNSSAHVEDRLFSRRVALTQGEALFTVSHGWRSFTVHANNTDILDIGTVFNVRNTQDGAIVTVLEGAVEVRLTNNQRMKAQLLTANQSLYTSATSLSTPANIDASNATTWQQGRLLFDGTPLGDAVAEIQRYRQAPIILQDQHVATLRISGAYDIAGIESLIDTLPISVAVTVKRKTDGTVDIHSR